MKHVVIKTKKTLRKPFDMLTNLSNSAGGADVPDSCDVPGGMFGEKADMIETVRRAIIETHLKHKVFIIHHKRVRI